MVSRHRSEKAHTYHVDRQDEKESRCCIFSTFCTSKPIRYVYLTELLVLVKKRHDTTTTTYKSVLLFHVQLLLLSGVFLYCSCCCCCVVVADCVPSFYIPLSLSFPFHFPLFRSHLNNSYTFTFQRTLAWLKSLSHAYANAIIIRACIFYFNSLFSLPLERESFFFFFCVFLMMVFFISPHIFSIPIL